MSESIQGRKVQSIARNIYIFLMGFLFLWYIHILAYYNSKPTPLAVQLCRGAAAVLAVWLGQLWKDRAWRLLTILWLMFFLRLAIGAPALLSEQLSRELLWLGLWLYSACFGLARVLPAKQLRRFLVVCLVVWLTATAVYSLAGIRAAWTQQAVYTFRGKGTFKVSLVKDEYRLKMLFGRNQAGAILCYSAMAALLLFFTTKKKAVRLLIILLLVIILLPMCLTGSRTSMIVFSLCLGGMAGISVVQQITKKKTGPVAWLSGAAVLGLTSVCTILLLLHVTPFFNQFRNNGLAVSRAGAENIVSEATAPDGENVDITEEEAENSDGIAERSLSDLSGRSTLWHDIFVYLGDEPQFLLYGASLIDPLELLNQVYRPLGYEHPHAHNTLLNVLVEAGIPGFLLALAIVIIIGIRGFRLVVSRQTPRWLCLSSVLMFAIWAGEMVECFLILLRYRTPLQPIGFVVMGLVSYYGQKPKQSVPGKSPETICLQ